MKVSKEYLNLIVDELKVVEEQWNSAKTPDEKLYYFSAIFGIVNRVMNFQTDPILVFVHQVLQTTHRAVNARLNAPRSPSQESFMGLPVEMIDALFSAVKALRLTFEKYASTQKADNDMWDVLKKLANISYAATGNGFYLYLRGKLQL